MNAIARRFGEVFRSTHPHRVPGWLPLLVMLCVCGTASWGEEQAPAAAPSESSESAVRAVGSLLLDIASSGERLVAVGERGNLLISDDGKAWTQVIVPTRSTLTAVVFADAQQGWAVGHDAVILHTADGGKTWALQSFQPELNQPLLDVYFLDARHGFAMGSFGLFLETLDGGGSWHEVNAPAVKEEGLHLNAMIRLRNGEVLVVGESGLLGLSSDCQLWDRLASPYEGSFFGAVPLGEKGAVIFGLRGNAFLSLDVRGGQWTPLDLGSTRSAFGGTSLPDGGAAIVGADGLMLTLDAEGRIGKAGVEGGQGNSDGGTLNSVVSWKGGLIAVGESGVQVRHGG